MGGAGWRVVRGGLLEVVCWVNVEEVCRVVSSEGRDKDSKAAGSGFVLG